MKKLIKELAMIAFMAWPFVLLGLLFTILYLLVNR